MGCERRQSTSPERLYLEPLPRSGRRRLDEPQAGLPAPRDPCPGWLRVGGQGAPTPSWRAGFGGSVFWRESCAGSG